jgi:hypothetical protein
MNDKREISLAFVVAVYTALVIALGMAVYAIYQYFAMPNETILGLVLEHSWHVVVLGVLTYVTLYAVLYKKVVLPIRDLYLKLYAITRGNLSSITVDSNIMEIAEIAEGVQLLIAETDRSVPEVSLAGLSESAQQLREVSKESNPLDDSEKDILLNVANKIDETVKGLTAAKQKAIIDESEQA